MPDLKATILRFGLFELDFDAQRLVREGRTVRLQPQPFKLLCLLATNAGKVVSRDDIRSALWSGDTFVDFDQGVNFAISQLRDALGEDAERPVYIQTVPRRGYKFVAPVSAVTGEEERPIETSTQKLSKLMWANISELRLAEQQRRLRGTRLKQFALVGGAALVTAAAILLLILLRG
jgi:DNA-binding winged helix-turn-helix (wHTH) protein